MTTYTHDILYYHYKHNIYACNINIMLIIITKNINFVIILLVVAFEMFGTGAPDLEGGVWVIIG